MKRTRGGRLALLVLSAAAALCGACVPPAEDKQAEGPAGARGPDSLVALSGLLETLHAEEAVGPALELPFTIELPAVGTGDATFNQALVGGATRTISWTGGRPLALEGEGSLDLGPTTIDVDATGIRYSLDGGPRVLLDEGSEWKTTAPVAIGAAGMATPRDGVTFTVGPETVVISTGGAFVRQDPTEVVIEGTGEATFTGEFRLASPEETADGIRRVRTEGGNFTITIKPVAGALQVDATMSGRVFVNDSGSPDPKKP